MKISPEIIQQGLIGLNAEVVKSSNSNYVGLTGRVVNETHNTLMLRHKNKNKTIIKNVAVLHFKMLDGTIVEIEGKTIVGRPDNRIKKRIRRQW